MVFSAGRILRSMTLSFASGVVIFSDGNNQSAGLPSGSRANHCHCDHGSLPLILPVEVLVSMGSPNQIVLPGWFLKFIGAAEVLGAIGLILPRLLHIRPRLTPLAAMGLVIIMIGATSLTLAADGFAPALVPMVGTTVSS